MGEKKKNEKNGEKKEENPVTVVLKVDMHCEGCANKIIKCIKGFEGVQTVKAEIDANKLTVLGKIDPSKLREKLANKSKKKVDLISPNTKKEKESKPDDSSNNKKPDDNKKPKEAPVTTAVLKVVLHCQGCIEKIQRSTSKFKGVHEMSMDKQKDLVTVKGLMDVKALCQSLSERLKRPVEIVPPKKEKDNDKDKDKKGGGGGGGDGEKNEGGEGKKKKKGGGDGGGGGGGVGGVGGGDGGGDGVHGGGGGKMEGNKMEYMPMAVPGYGYGYGYGLTYGYGPGGLVGEHLHAPQLFSDENPNACYIM